MTDKRKQRSSSLWTLLGQDRGPELKFDSLVWETNTLAKTALMALINRFPQYGPIVDSNLIETWDCLMTIAMTGVAAHARGILSDSPARRELKRLMKEKWQVGPQIFDDYYEYAISRTTKVEAPWSAVSAMWVADNLRLHRKANATLKQNARELEFVNCLSAFMRMAFGNTEFGFPHFLAMMASSVEKEKGIDMGIGTKGTKQDPDTKASMLVYIFESFARKTVELIANHERSTPVPKQ